MYTDFEIHEIRVTTTFAFVEINELLPCKTVEQIQCVLHVLYRAYTVPTPMSL